MSTLLQFSFDGCLQSLLACIMMREIFIVALPDNIAGPGGWFIDTAPRG